MRLLVGEVKDRAISGCACGIVCGSCRLSEWRSILEASRRRSETGEFDV